MFGDIDYSSREKVVWIDDVHHPRQLERLARTPGSWVKYTPRWQFHGRTHLLPPTLRCEVGFEQTY
jgi:hypothetical protein